MANYFIHPNEIKATAYVDENADDKLITNAIAIAQDLYILPMIGTGIYNELKTQIGASTLTALNTTLLGAYIVPALRYCALYELAEPMTYKFTNKSVVKKNSENSEPVTFQELTALKDKFLNIAQWYTERLKLYLVENESDYPLYSNPGNGIDVIHPKHDSYSCGWYLGESHESVPDFIKAEFPATYGTE